MLRLAAAAGMMLALLAGSASAQTPQVRLAASLNCPRNVNCIPGLKRVYGMDPTSVYVPRSVADAGVQALDDGVAEVAVVFSSNPQLSRPEILALRDDRGMITADQVVPVVRRSLLRRHGLRRRLDAASRLLSTLELRGLNQQVIDGRLPEAVGGEFADANGLGGPSRRRAGRRITVGYQAFDENETLAYLYARRCAARASASGSVRSADCVRRRWPPCVAATSTCGPPTTARCSATSADGRSSAPLPASARGRCGSRPLRIATASP